MPLSRQSVARCTNQLQEEVAAWLHCWIRAWRKLAEEHLLGFKESLQRSQNSTCEAGCCSSASYFQACTHCMANLQVATWLQRDMLSQVSRTEQGTRTRLNDMLCTHQAEQVHGIPWACLSNVLSSRRQAWILITQDATDAFRATRLGDSYSPGAVGCTFAAVSSLSLCAHKPLSAMLQP